MSAVGNGLYAALAFFEYGCEWRICAVATSEADLNQILVPYLGTGKEEKNLLRNKAISVPMKACTCLALYKLGGHEPWLGMVTEDLGDTVHLYVFSFPVGSFDIKTLDKQFTKAVGSQSSYLRSDEEKQELRRLGHTDVDF